MLHVKPVLVLAWIAVLPAPQRIFVYLILPYVYNNAQKDTLKTQKRELVYLVALLVDLVKIDRTIAQVANIT
uniref:Putative secreted protein n=1 Tax=Xenopsylla cheopis TaxID=163159 RepID=A0A6M2DUI6_XENCH